MAWYTADVTHGTQSKPYGIRSVPDRGLAWYTADVTSVTAANLVGFTIRDTLTSVPLKPQTDPVWILTLKWAIDMHLEGPDCRGYLV